MSYPGKIVLRRKRRSSAGRLSLFGKSITWLMTFGFLAILGLAFFAGTFYVQLIKDLPPVGNIEIMFTETENGFLAPVQVYDRSNTKLFDLLHPAALDRRWHHIGDIGDDVVPEALLNAMVVAHDENFWSNQGVDLGPLIRYVLQGGSNTDVVELARSIPQQLIKMTILPSDDFLQPDLWRTLREAILAHRLIARYSKNQILEWYINSVYFGNLAFGVDAAALVYFNKHAAELTLAESTLLAAISTQPTIEPFEIPEHLREKQEHILQVMLEQGWITKSQSQRALLESVELNGQQAFQGLDLQRYTLDRIVNALGVAITDRAGLYVFTTINREIQSQVQCEAEFLLRGLDDQGSEGIIEGEKCRASEALQLQISGDESIPSGVESLASVILDSKTGELLSIYGPLDEPMPSASMLYPFVYLAAFSRGSSPGTMVLDLPLDNLEEPRFEGIPSHGPILIRNALVEGYPFAIQRTIQSVGLENVLQVIRQMGVTEIQSEADLSLGEGFPELHEISLINAVSGYGILANSGKIVGTTGERTNENVRRLLGPIFIREVIDRDGRNLYTADTEEQSVVSQELAFLVTDVLQDSAVVKSPFERSDLFKLNRPSAVMSGMNQDENLSWTIGYTPSRVVGLWLGDRSQEGADRSVVSWASQALWYAFMIQVTQNQPAEDWQKPAGIIQVDICEPSGLLPTSYCPSVVGEIFLDGTEPVHYDMFYQPFRINKETGKLATLFTPFDLVVEKVFFVPPPEATEWAREEGYLQPPNEYDNLTVASLDEDSVQIDIPKNFDYIGGEKWISGRTKVDNFKYFRLQYGEGLDPTHWFQIGENQFTPIEEGTLIMWDTLPLEGLYALQLIVVDQDDIAYIDTTYVTVDNERPEVILICPEDVLRIDPKKGQSITCEAQVSDNIGISKVEFFIDEQRFDIDFTEPFILQMETDRLTTGTLSARAYDLAGNISQSKGIEISIVE
jgi:membrane carboxypeptidase/penicillin-binding protein